MIALILKYKFALTIILMIGVITGYFYFWQKGLKDDIAYWKNHAAKQSQMLKLSESAYESQAFEVDRLKIDNKLLLGHLEQTKREAKVYMELAFSYKREIGRLKSRPVDSVFITTTDTVYRDPRDRDFSFDDKELSLSGYFQPYDPYDIFINSLKLKFGVDILLSEMDDGSYFTSVDTKSKYLTPENINVQIKAIDPKIRFILGGSLLFEGYKPKIIGSELSLGVIRDKWGLSGAASYMFDDKRVISKIGILRYLN